VKISVNQDKFTFMLQVPGTINNAEQPLKQEKFF